MSVSRLNTLRAAYLALCKENNLVKIKSFLKANQQSFPDLLISNAFHAGMIELSRCEPSLTSIIMNLIIQLAPDQCIFHKLPKVPLAFPSLLHTAAHYGDLRAIRLLLQRGHLINIPSALPADEGEIKDTIYPIHIAAGFGSIDVLAQLIKSGADVNQLNNSGMTPLIFSVQNDKALNNGLLIERGANIALQDDSGKNVLHYAALFQVEDNIFLDLIDVITTKNVICLFDKDALGHTAIQQIAIHKAEMLPKMMERLVHIEWLKKPIKTPISLNELYLVRSLISAGFSINTLQLVSAKMVNNFNISSLFNQKLKLLTPAKVYAETAIPLINIVLQPSDTIFIHPVILQSLIYMRNALSLLKEKSNSFVTLKNLANLSVDFSNIECPGHLDIGMYTQQNYIFEFLQFLLKNYNEYVNEMISDFSNNDVVVKDQVVFFGYVAGITNHLNTMGEMLRQAMDYYSAHEIAEDFILSLEKEILLIVEGLGQAKESAMTTMRKRDEALASLLNDSHSKHGSPKAKKNKSKRKKAISVEQKAEPSSSAVVAPVALAEIPKAYFSIALTKQMRSAFSLIPFEAYIVGGSVFDILSKTENALHDVDLVCAVENVEVAIQELISRQINVFYRPFPDKALLQIQLEDGLKVDLLVREKTSVWFELDQSDRDFRTSMFYVNRLGELQFTSHLLDGLEDIKHNRLVMTGDPMQRFNQDPVRILRAIKSIMRGMVPDASLKQALLNWRPEGDLINQHCEHINAIFRAMINGEHADLFVQLLNEYAITPRLLGDNAPNTVEALRLWLSRPVANAVIVPATNQVLSSYPTMMAMLTYMPVLIPVMVYSQQMFPPSNLYSTPCTFFTPIPVNVTQNASPQEFDTASTQLAQQVIHRNCGQH